MDKRVFLMALAAGCVWAIVLAPILFVHWVAASVAFGVRTAGAFESVNQRLSTYVMYIATPLVAIGLLAVLVFVTGYPTAILITRLRGAR